MNSTLKVGIITLFGLSLLSYMVFIIGDLRLTERGYRFIVTFYTVNGLSTGSSLSMAGVKIGKVESIDIREDQVFVSVYVKDKKYKIRRRSTFTIGTAGLMGEKFVDIIPTRDQTSPYVRNDSFVDGTDPMRMEELFESGNELLKKLQGLTASAKDIVGDPELKQSTRAIFRNAEMASKNINGIIESVRGKVDNIVGNLDNILKNIDDQIVDNKDNIHAIIENLKEFSAKLSTITEDNRGNIKDLVGNMKQVSIRIDDMVEKLNKNNNMTDNLRQTIKSLRKASENAHEITQEVKEIVTEKDIRKKIKTGLDDAHKIAQAVDKVFLNIKQTRIDFKYLLRYHKDTEKFFSDMMVDIYPTDTSFYRIGVEDIGGDPLFNLMLSKDAQQKFIKRGGIISSKVGLGADYQWSEDIMYSLDFIDTRDPTIRFTSSYLLKPGLKLQLRVDDITDEKAVNFAVEYKF